ncbi:Transmembrane protein 86A, partial [Danaus plexippus plexippus]
MISPSSI